VRHESKAVEAQSNDAGEQRNCPVAASTWLSGRYVKLTKPPRLARVPLMTFAAS